MYGPNFGHNGLWISEEPEITPASSPDHPGFKAFASIVLNDSLRVGDIRIVKIGDRLIVAFPSKEKADGRHYDLCHPLDHKTRRYLETHILQAYCDERERESDAFVAAHPKIFGFMAERKAC